VERVHCIELFENIRRRHRAVKAETFGNDAKNLNFHGTADTTTRTKCIQSKWHTKKTVNRLFLFVFAYRFQVFAKAFDWVLSYREKTLGSGPGPSF
jgi:hypothetical protein